MFEIDAVGGHRVSITSEVGYLRQRSQIWWAQQSAAGLRFQASSGLEAGSTVQAEDDHGDGR